MNREAYLVETRAYTPQQVAWAKASIERGELGEMERRTKQESLQETETLSEVMERLKSEGAAVSDWATRGELLAYLEDDVLRFPKWQFAETGITNGPTVPHLAEVIAATRDLHPSTVTAIMSSRQDELRINTQRVTPVQWLASGRGVQSIIDIFEAYLWS